MLTVSVKKVIARDHDVVGNVMYCDRTSNQQWRAKILKKPAVLLTEELVQKIQPRPYKTYVTKLREQDAVTGENYKNLGGPIISPWMH